MGRAPCCDKANVKKGPWSPEEDAKLKSYIEANGTGGNWIALPQKIGLKRCGKSCRLRWLNYLRPNIKHGGFTEEEENIICNLYLHIGSRWSVIAAQLPERTDNDIKNYWNTRLKKKLMAKQRKEQQLACRLLEQEMKRETETFLVTQTLNNQATYWANQQTSMPIMAPNYEPHFNNNNGNNNYHYPTHHNQFYVGPSEIQASNIAYTQEYDDVNGVTMNIMHQGHEAFPPELEAYLNNQLSFDGGNESYSSGVDLGSSSMTSNSVGSSGWDDINTPGSSFDDSQNGL